MIQLLKHSNYSERKIEFLKEGFTNGFSLHYQGNRQGQFTLLNLKLDVGTPTELWNKVMKEVQARRYAGPFETPPFKDFVQSLIGLVPKDQGKKTRLIFHLSYPRKSSTNRKSINECTPKEKCTVKYKDFDCAVKLCLKEGKGCSAGKTDVISAFRIIPVRPEDWPLLVMRALNPRNNRLYYFVDKCLPFGHSISCALFQELSDALSHLAEFHSGKQNVNYLDDFFFVAIIQAFCNKQLRDFRAMTGSVGVALSPEKTVWGSTMITFLGLLIDTVRQLVGIPLEKIDKIRKLINWALDKKKLRLRVLQSLCGHLNFICKAIVPGRPFLRRLYFATGSTTGKQSSYLTTIYVLPGG